MNTTALYRGKRNYELSNHVGDFKGCWFRQARPYSHESRERSDSGVQATISDKRRSVCNEELGIAFFEAEVLTQTEYYPFGAVMPDRQWSAGAEGYRFGFNGGEKINEVYGQGNYVDLVERGVDIRLGRLNWRTDPYFGKNPSISPYVFADNITILFIDLNGNFKLLPSDKEKYKHLDNLLHKIEAKGTEEKLIQMFSKHTGLNNERTQEYLSYGNGPLIEIGKVGGDGVTFEDNGSVRTILNKKFINKLEKLGNNLEEIKNDPGASEKKLKRAEKKFKDYALFIEKTILHEGVHQGDHESNKTFTDDFGKGKAESDTKQKFESPNNERGKDFEIEYYGESY